MYFNGLSTTFISKELLSPTTGKKYGSDTFFKIIEVEYVYPDMNIKEMVGLEGIVGGLLASKQVQISLYDS